MVAGIVVMVGGGQQPAAQQNMMFGGAQLKPLKASSSAPLGKVGTLPGGVSASLKSLMDSTQVPRKRVRPKRRRKILPLIQYRGPRRGPRRQRPQQQDDDQSTADPFAFRQSEPLSKPKHATHWSAMLRGEQRSMAEQVTRFPERDEPAMWAAKDEQHANQKNSNRRYHSDTDFYDELKLAHRLVLEKRLTKSEAERMVLDSSMFSYWVESRLRHAITAVVEFAENAYKYGLNWNLKTRQEVVDLVSKVPYNHAVHIMSKHVCATLSGRSYGYYSKQEWDGYLTWALAKAAFPDPYTSIYVLVKV